MRFTPKSSANDSKSYLSQAITVRLGMRAGSCGTISLSGWLEMMKPPTWMDRCRGAPVSCLANSKICSVRQLLEASFAVPSGLAGGGAESP